MDQKINTKQFDLIIQSLTLRSSTLKKRANIIQFSIVIFILAGITFFWFSDSLIKENTFADNAQPILDDIRITLSNTSNRLGELHKSNCQLDSILEITTKEASIPVYSRILNRGFEDLNKSLKEGNFPDKEKQRIKKLIESLEALVTDIIDGNNTLKKDVAQLNEMQERYNGQKTTQLKLIQSRLDTLDYRVAITVDKINSETLDNTNIILSASVIRIGIVLLLIFLIQIFVSLYRYTYRLAAFYDARVDTLNILSDQDNIDAITLEKMTNFLSPHNITFNKSPQSPTDQAIEMAKELIKSKHS